MGLLIGLSYNYLAIIAACVVITLIMVPLWLVRQDFGLLSVLVWIGYLFAIQSGFLVGGYVRTDDDP
ncbi:MAG TPA: hypothetical protein VGN82_14700 [Bosea sp. (in: a-proteobacteria)]|uniref:hypothetical protein n=1 Tax=Bosea sp. (in: a-proteobacteria) TaxID=1871050 RepID=UPI002E14EC57|nr:hypothetical protein [Bosea sp. (in: a-proteobacteria)]